MKRNRQSLAEKQAQRILASLSEQAVAELAKQASELRAGVDAAVQQLFLPERRQWDALREGLDATLAEAGRLEQRARELSAKRAMR